MDKQFWIRKLTSRKFWVSIVGFVTALLVGFGVDTNYIERVTAIIYGRGYGDCLYSW